MNRFKYAIDVSESPTALPLYDLSLAMAEAVRETVTEGGNPLTDPAVIMISAFIAFQTNVDVMYASHYRVMLEKCGERLRNMEFRS